MLLFLPAMLLSSCSDECESTTTFIVYEPVYMLRTELKNAVKVTLHKHSKSRARSIQKATTFSSMK
ncbi:hypothetical protein O71_03129 [Pontibacter sp. BAB1700]|nr:hypothetical protein O71_03129 [Pontibacter sp. BAB1700]